MALDATVAGVSANSYLSIAAADLLAAADTGPEVTAWTAATTDQKERALKRATREIDAFLRSGWLRYGAAQSVAFVQALLFPRAIDVSGSPALPFLPRAVQLATYEQATYVHKNATVLDAAAVRRAQDMQSATQSNLSYTRSAEEGANVLSPAALVYLEGYRRAGGARGIRTVRMSSGYLT